MRDGVALEMEANACFAAVFCCPATPYSLADYNKGSAAAEAIFLVLLVTVWRRTGKCGQSSIAGPFETMRCSGRKQNLRAIAQNRAGLFPREQRRAQMRLLNVRQLSDVWRTAMILQPAKRDQPPGSSQRPVHVEESAIRETSVEARQGFLGRPVLVVLCVSLAIAIAAGIFLWSSNL